MKKILLAVMILSSASIGFTSIYAAEDSGSQVEEDSGSQASAPTLTNPIGGVTSLSGFFYKLLNFIVSLSYVVVAFFLLLSGFKFVMAQGSPDKLQEAKSTFYWTIIGAVLVIGAQVITEVVKSIITEVAKG